MAYEGAYQAQRPYSGPRQPRADPGPYPPRQPRHDDYQGGPGYDYYDDGSGYGPEYGGQYQDPGYARGPPLDHRSPPRSRSDYPGQPHLQNPGRGGPPMPGGRGGPGGPLQRAQTMEPMGNGPYPARGVPPPGPGRGYPNAPPGRGGPPGGYGRGPPPNMDPASKSELAQCAVCDGAANRVFVNRSAGSTAYERTNAESGQRSIPEQQYPALPSTGSEERRLQRRCVLGEQDGRHGHVTKAPYADGEAQRWFRDSTAPWVWRAEPV